MYTAIAQTRNITIEASSLLLETTSTEKRSYQYNKLFYTFISLPVLRRSIPKRIIISSLHYSCLLNEFSDIITILVLAVGIPHAPKLPPNRGLVDFHMMAQYRSHTLDTIAYMEEYLDQFHRMKDIFLEFQVTKCTQAKVDKQRKEIRRQRALMRERVATSQRRRMRDDDRDEEHELRMVMI